MFKKLRDIFVNQDIFGHSIGVQYKGDATFKTKLGAFVTLAIYTIVI